MPSRFIHLCVHSGYSLLRGVGSVKAILHRAAEMGYDALALTDTNALYGAMEFMDRAKACGVRPILGAEILHPTGRAVCLIANRTGYANLCRILTARHIAASFDTASAVGAHAEGLFVLAREREMLRRLRDVLPPGRLFREVRPRDTASADADLADIPSAASNNVHFPTPEGYAVHRTLAAIRLNTLLPNVPPDAAADPGDWLRGGEEMERLFGPKGCEAVRNTRRIADACDLAFDRGRPIFPRFFDLEDAQRRFPGETPYSALCRVAIHGARRRFHPITPDVMRRLHYELDVIHRLGFAEYFLVVWDLVRFARREGIPVVGRGSAANSLVAYVLDITSVDPLRHHLYFERFLNRSRTDCPDIDLDLCWRRRDAVIQYVYARYGSDRVAMVSTVTTFQARSAFRDAARVMGLPMDAIRRISACLPYDAGGDLRAALRRFPEGRTVPVEEEPYRTVLACAEALDGAPRHLAVHVGGIVIADRPLTDYVPLERAAKGLVVTQYEKNSIERVGLVKLDLLGHRTLSVIADTSAAVARRQGTPPDLTGLPEEDEGVASLLHEGRTIGCFQIESPGMRSLLRMLHASTRRDVIHALSLIRPGPSASGMKERFIRRRLGEEAVEYDDPRLEPVLRETHGVMLFQEDILKVAQVIAGFTLEQGDALRKAISKQRSPERVEALRGEFLAGARRRGATTESAARLWQCIANFAAYSYCKAHAVTYGGLAWQATWLKAHHPAEFLAALLTNRAGFYAPREYIEEARRSGVRILPPDVNRSAVRHTGGNGALRVGLGQIKGLSRRSLRSILRARRTRPFADLEDFYYRTQVNDGETERLILCGALGGFGLTRPQLLWQHRVIARNAGRGVEASLGGGLFPTPTADAPAAGAPPPPPLPEYPLDKRIALELEFLDLAVSAHPLASFDRALAGRRLTPSSELDRHVGRRVTVVGWLVTMRHAVTTRREYMKFVTLEDRFGTIEITLFPDVYQRFGHRLRDYGPYLVRGRVDGHHRALGITAEWINPLESGEATP